MTTTNPSNPGRLSSWDYCNEKTQSTTPTKTTLVRNLTLLSKALLYILIVSVTVLLTLMPDCRMETGKEESGRELSHRRNWGSTSSDEELLNLQTIRPWFFFTHHKLLWQTCKSYSFCFHLLLKHQLKPLLLTYMHWEVVKRTFLHNDIGAGKVFYTLWFHMCLALNIL